ncbi:MAG: phosphatase [Gorillibacterium sp.]|nr:phosphatase [Gorillibacterium sp.]
MVIAGERRGVEVIPGIEISAYDTRRNRRIHILGYYIDSGHISLSELCNPLLAERHQNCYLIVKQLVDAGYKITWEQVQQFAKGGTGVYKQHIMHALLVSGYTKTIYGDLYKKLFSRGKDGETPGIAYLPTTYVDAHSAIQAVLQAGGIPVLAHPGQYGSFEAVPELVASGLAGIEVRHPLHGLEDEAEASRLATEYGLIQTGGSDFHGFYGETDYTLGSKDPGVGSVEALKALRSKHIQNGVVINHAAHPSSS